MATLKDVAKESGYTVTTVSRILNNRGYISEAARMKVYESIKKLNYHPNEVARSLSMQTTSTIGVIVPHVRHPYFSKLISCLESQAYKHGYKILLFNSDDKNEKEKEYLNLCSRNRVDGIILCSGDIKLQDFERFDTPIITIERYAKSSTTSISCDNYLGGKLAAEHLIEQGCKNLLYFGKVNETKMPADLRSIGFLEVCEQKQITFQKIETKGVIYNQKDYKKEIFRALEENQKTDGVFTSSDIIAAQFLQVCATMKKSVPDEIKVIGFDDSDISEFLIPRLTTIRQPLEEMAEHAMTSLIRAKEGELIPSQMIMPVKLMKREST